MTSRRTAKIAQAIREIVSSTILFGLKDPRVKNVTVLDVEVAGDARSAKVYVSIRGSEKEQALCLHGLNSARGFLQSKVADRVKTRYTPILRFVADQSVKLSVEAARILREIEREDQQPDSTENPHTENPHTENPHTENPHTEDSLTEDPNCESIEIQEELPE